MGQSFSVRDFIQLPTMEAHTLETFVRRLLAQFRKHRAELRRTKVTAHATALETALHALTASLAAAQSRTRGTHDAAQLDPAVDATWSALMAFLDAWAKLTWLDEGKTAKLALDAIFPTGLDFTQRKYPQQWSEANARIQQIHTRDADHPRESTLAQKIHALGGHVFLDEIADKHTRFGKALGLTEGKSVPSSVDIRGPYDDSLGAAKDYVAAVMQLDEHDVDAPDAMKRELLSVLDEFATPARQPASTGSAPATGGTTTGSGG